MDIGIEVITNLLVVGKVIQGDLFKGQEAGDLLEKRYSKVRPKYSNDRQIIVWKIDNSKNAAHLPSRTMF